MGISSVPLIQAIAGAWSLYICSMISSTMAFVENMQRNFTEGATLSLATLLMTAVLELTAIPTVRGLCKQAGGSRLYLKGLAMNVINLAYGAVAYSFLVPIVCSPIDWEYGERVRGVIMLLTTHAIIYWAAHKAMHTRALYWMHRFHHRFNKHVPPSSANAVSIFEFIVAYSAPFLAGALLFGCDRATLQVAVAIQYLLSALVHTPWMQHLSKQFLPWFIVSTHDHMEHHRLLNKHYASPTWNVDRILKWVLAESESHARCAKTPRAERVTPCRR